MITGRLSNSDAHLQMATHDYLILPSLYDGWGAVVNEALSVGTRVLCSKACGASILLDGNERGEAFSQKNDIQILKKWICQGNLSVAERMKIIYWANENITGNAASNYFLKTLRNEYVQAPWI